MSAQSTPTEGMTAQEVNAAVRAQFVELFTCCGRPLLAQSARVQDLVSCVGMVFAELAQVEGRVAADSVLRELATLRELVKAGSAPYQAQIELLNHRLTAANAACMRLGAEAWLSPDVPPAAPLNGAKASVQVLAVIDDPALKLEESEEPFVDMVTYWPLSGLWTVTYCSRASDSAVDHPVHVLGWQPLPPVMPLASRLRGLLHG